MTLQFRQLLVYWPDKDIEPTMQITMARKPLEQATRKPDKVLTDTNYGRELNIYYWGWDCPDNYLIWMGHHVKIQS